jgi:hypothetical protein
VGELFGPMIDVRLGDMVSDAMAVGLILGLEEGNNTPLCMGLG